MREYASYSFTQLPVHAFNRYPVNSSLAFPCLGRAATVRRIRQRACLIIASQRMDNGEVSSRLIDNYLDPSFRYLSLRILEREILKSDLRDGRGRSGLYLEIINSFAVKFNCEWDSGKVVYWSLILLNFL